MLEVNTIYNKLMEIYKDKFFSNREKLILYFDVVKEFFNSIVLEKNIVYTEYALFHYILKQFEVPIELKTNIINLRKYISKLRKQSKLKPTKSFVSQIFSNIVQIISFITKSEIPNEIFIILPNSVPKLKIENEVSQSSIIKNLTVTISYKLFFNQNIIIICQNDDNKYVISIDEKLVYQCSMAKKLNMICFTELEGTEAIISNFEEENELFSGSLFYKTTYNTQIILEPNFLVDVTELTDCFQIKNSNPIISIIKRLYPNNTTSIPAFEGNIINHFFDELLENIEVDFDTCINNALVKNPLALVFVAQQNTEVDSNNLISKYLKDNRSRWFDKYNKLRDIILENFIKTTNIIEPSFISNIYGLQGRLDLMIEKNIEQYKSIDIIELKSSKAPTKLCHPNIGLFNKRKYSIPLWVNHYIQIVCYNMLLEHILVANNSITGSSAILYADPAETQPLRSVVEDNILIKSEILLFRNYIVMFLKEFADGNISFIENIDENQILETFPKYDVEHATILIKKIYNLSSLEKAYFNLQLSFVMKEMFAQKIGLYVDTSYNINRNGFSSLWLNSIEEKQLWFSAISDLSLDMEHSDLDKMYLTFNRNAEYQYDINIGITPFRENDICIMYPLKNKDITSIDNQIFRGRILEINDNFVKVSFRNKLSKKLFQNDYLWCLEADYMEKSNSIIFNSISNFVFNDFENKNCILGISEPTFTINEKINNAVCAIPELDLEKKDIIINALLANNYYLIQGPPGTGKTAYILRYLTQLLFSTTDKNILLLAHTNRAVDEICSSILKIKKKYSDFDFIRLGNKTSSKYPNYILSNIKINELENRINNCRIYVSTIQTANSNPELFKIKEIDTIIIDEAAQILESHLIGLLSKVKRFIMIGDEKQLPPITILAKQHLKVTDEILNENEIKNLNESLFERLLRFCKIKNIPAYSLLSQQHRMSNEIMFLANEMFYDGKLKCNNDFNINNNIIKLNTTCNFLSKNIFADKDCFFINTPTTNTNKTNNYEIDIILKIIELIKEKMEINNNTIGIISPWRMQCSAIINKLNEEDKKLITIDTVERFQGSEREIIIFSAATNSNYLLNILSNIVKIDNISVDRKLNVAITRAKKKFILLGNYDILSQNPIYKKLISLLEWLEIK